MSLGFTYNDKLYSASLGRKVRFLSYTPDKKSARVRYLLRDTDPLPEGKEPRSDTEMDAVYTTVPVNDLTVPEAHYAEGNTQPEDY